MELPMAAVDDGRDSEVDAKATLRSGRTRKWGNAAECPG
jgi:hypothetical protein